LELISNISAVDESLLPVMFFTYRITIYATPAGTSIGRIATALLL
jgi:hypothetical protein